MLTLKGAALLLWVLQVHIYRHLSCSYPALQYERQKPADPALYPLLKAFWGFNLSPFWRSAPNHLVQSVRMVCAVWSGPTKLGDMGGWEEGRWTDRAWRREEMRRRAECWPTHVWVVWPPSFIRWCLWEVTSSNVVRDLPFLMLEVQPWRGLSQAQH